MTGTLLLILRILIALSLFAFLGFALYILWRDLRRQAQEISSRKVPSLVLEQPETGQTLTFFKPEVLIGRDPLCDCRLDERTVSSQHARLSFHHNNWWLEDLKSTNGTFLNQEPVHAPLVITSGDQLRCGQVILNIQIGDGAISASAGKESGT